MKHSLRLARMSRMDLTPNPVDDGHDEEERPVRARHPLSHQLPPLPAPVPEPPAEPIADPASTWNAPPVTWEAVAPPPIPPAPPAPLPADVERPREPRPLGADLPGSGGEHLLQLAYGTRSRAERFYDEQLSRTLNSQMREFIGRMEMAFIATADGHGEADCSLRAGPPGFIQVLDERHIAYPEYRGNGVLASLGNISENPHVGILMVDFVRDRIGLHVNGRAMIVDDEAFRAEFEGIPVETVRGRMPERWVLVEVDEAYIHCRKHIPGMQAASADQAWGSDDVKRKGGDYFGAKAGRQVETERADEPSVGGERVVGDLVECRTGDEHP